MVTSRQTFRSPSRPGDGRGSLVDVERQEDAVDPLRVGVQRDQGLTGQVLGRVHDQAILAQDHDHIGLGKCERRQERPVDPLDAQAPGMARRSVSVAA